MRRKKKKKIFGKQEYLDIENTLNLFCKNKNKNNLNTPQKKKKRKKYQSRFYV